MIEINGLANIHILLQQVEADFGHEYGLEEGEAAILKIKEQLDLLERYMLAFAEATQRGERPPYWHEVRENPSNFKLNRER
jgi:hypothetical protein